MEISPKRYAAERIARMTPTISYRSGDQISGHQKIGREVLSGLLGIDRIKENASSCEATVEYDRFDAELDAREIKLLVEGERGLAIPCYLFVPRKRRSDGSPLVLALHGHSTGVHTSMGREKYPIDSGAIREQRCDIVRQGVLLGYCVLAIEHRGFGERGGDERGSQCTHIAMQALLLGRTLLGERVFDAMCALDAICRDFSDVVRTDRIVCVGYSGGGTIASCLSALDTRITDTVIVSAISSISRSIGAISHCPCNYVPRLAEYFDMGEICQLIAPRRLLVVSGKDDPIFPFAAAKEAVGVAKRAYNAFYSLDNITHIASDGGHRFYPDEVWGYINELYK